jgi:hypothetical protein
VIVWINGAFGAGKSTVTSALLALRPDFREFDPEYVGYVLRRFVPNPSGDFQDLALWRRLTVQFAYGLDRLHPATWVVPMTLLRADYRAEILDGLRGRGVALRHVVLSVPEATLRARIDADAELHDAREWRHSHVDGALAALRDLPDTIEVSNADGREPAEVASEILERLGLRALSATEAPRP